MEQGGWCPTAAFGTDTIIAIVAKYLREHPDEWGKTPNSLVLAPLALKKSPVDLNLRTSLDEKDRRDDLDSDEVACHHLRIHFDFGSTICLPSFGDFQGFP